MGGEGAMIPFVVIGAGVYLLAYTAATLGALLLTILWTAWRIVRWIVLRFWIWTVAVRTSGAI